MDEPLLDIIKRLARIQQLLEVHDKALRMMATRHLDNTEQLISTANILERLLPMEMKDAEIARLREEIELWKGGPQA